MPKPKNVDEKRAPAVTIYLGSVPGVGKTYRLLADARAEARIGRKVAIGRIEMKHRADLEELAAGLPVIPARRYRHGDIEVEDFDFDAALASDADLIILDELAHTNPQGASHNKRWQDVLALRAAGKSVLTACNVMHLESAAPVAERITGYPVKEIVPMEVIRNADRVVAIDVSGDVLAVRLRQNRIVRDDDVDRAAAGIFRPANVQMMRELLLRVVDDLTIPVVLPSQASTALALVTESSDPLPFLSRVAAIADALNLSLEVAQSVDEIYGLDDALIETNATRIDPPEGIAAGDLRAVKAALVAITRGRLAPRLLREPLDRDLLIAAPERLPLPRRSDNDVTFAHFRNAQGFGKLTVYLGAVAGSGKTFAMLDRAHQLGESGVDVVGAFVETHGRIETEAKIGSLELLPRRPDGEMDLDALLSRKPKVALIDELPHTNAMADRHRKRFEDVLEVLEAGIDVVTALNVQHLEGVGDAVERLTGTRVRELVPDALLEIAADVVFIDVTPDVLQQRLREGKIYPLARIETALANFFRTENLTALRELAVREVVHARGARRHGLPFSRIIVGVAARERDARLIEQAGRLAKRVGCDLLAVCIHSRELPPAVLERFQAATQAAGAELRVESAVHPALRIVQLAGEDDIVLVESPRKRRGFFGKTSFAARLLRAGVAEMLVLVPRR